MSITEQTTSPIIICVVNQKGGCCKTATSMQLSGTLQKAGFSVFVADMDPQNTASLWSLQADPETPFPATVLSLAPLREAFLDKLVSAAKNYQFIIIDCPPAVESPVPWAALMAADLAIIPVIPLMDNVWASKQMEEMVLRARTTRRDRGISGELHAGYLLSQVRRGNVFESCEAALRKQAQLPIFQTRIALRNVYPESQVFGTTVHSLGKSPAVAEFDALGKEVLDMLGVKMPKHRGNRK
ncbi:ParA family protein [Massilia sp. Mn16-1_5]|uniref:ParA family protein n=1 Tax=Massilia sp. Mn16-1_5 TaxID=2079199 RepID=UPI00109E684A|nr:ParA family protein [Massilia sp. Mn16-1_5]THC39680.1 cobyrinic acid a,c-diamide synthase [Massilia sp. Mn16-1_5]